MLDLHALITDHKGLCFNRAGDLVHILKIDILAEQPLYGHVTIDGINRVFQYWYADGSAFAADSPDDEDLVEYSGERLLAWVVRKGEIQDAKNV